MKLMFVFLAGLLGVLLVNCDPYGLDEYRQESSVNPSQAGLHEPNDTQADAEALTDSLLISTFTITDSADWYVMTPAFNAAYGIIEFSLQAEYPLNMSMVDTGGVRTSLVVDKSSGVASVLVSAGQPLYLHMWKSLMACEGEYQLRVAQTDLDTAASEPSDGSVAGAVDVGGVPVKLSGRLWAAGSYQMLGSQQILYHQSDVDWFRFSQPLPYADVVRLVYSSTLEVPEYGHNSGIELTVMDSAGGTEVAQMDGLDSLEVMLDPGEYTLRVRYDTQQLDQLLAYQVNGIEGVVQQPVNTPSAGSPFIVSLTPSYTLDLTLLYQNDSLYEPNDTITQAYDIGTLPLSAGIEGTVVRAEQDWYRFSPFSHTRGGVVRLTHFSDNRDLSLKLFDSSMTGLDTTYTRTVDAENSDTLFLPHAGNYWLELSDGSGYTNSSYAFSLDTIFSADSYEPNNTQDSAFLLTALSTDSMKLNVWPGGGEPDARSRLDDVDWLSFILTAEDSIVLEVSAPFPVTLEWSSDDGSDGMNREYPDAGSVFRDTLAYQPGTYFLGVSRRYSYDPYFGFYTVRIYPLP